MPTDDSAEPIDLGTAGASARREHARLQSGRVQRTRGKHRFLGGLLLQLRDAPQSERAWANGADGEEQVAQALAKRLNEGSLVLHDRRIPRSKANIDHIAVAPSGVWVIDAKRYKGKVEIRTPLFGKAKLIVAGRDRSKLIDGLASQVELVRTELATIAPGIPLRGALCFVQADLPLVFKLTFRDFPVLYPRQLAKRINVPGPLDAAEINRVARALAASFPAA